VRGCTWASVVAGSGCQQGFIHPTEGVTGNNWNALVDGNGAEGRVWPSAQTPTSTSYRMPSLCASALHIPGAYVYQGYFWRL